jgi:hypothetical protein
MASAHPPRRLVCRLAELNLRTTSRLRHLRLGCPSSSTHAVPSRPREVKGRTWLPNDILMPLRATRCCWVTAQRTGRCACNRQHMDAADGGWVARLD